MIKPSAVMLLCTWLLAAAIASPALADAPAPRSFGNLSVDDLSIVCEKILHDAAADGTRLVYITDDEARGAHTVLRQSLAWRNARARFDANRVQALHGWLQKRPVEEHFEQFKWCMATGAAIHRSLSQETRWKIDKEAKEEFLRLRLNRELQRETR